MLARQALVTTPYQDDSSLRWRLVDMSQVSVRVRVRAYKIYNHFESYIITHALMMSLYENDVWGAEELCCGL